MPSPLQATHNRGARAQRGCLATFIGWVVALAVFAWTNSTAKVKDDNVIGTVALILAILVAPALGILYGIDLLPYLNWRKKKGSNILWRGLILLGSWLSALAVLFIVFTTGAAGLDSDWRHQDANKVTATLVCGVVCLLCLWLAWALFKMPFSRSSISTEAAEEKMLAEYQHYMEHPDFAGLEAKAGHSLPAAYKAMFAPDSEWRAGSWMLYPGGLDDDEHLYGVFGLHPQRLDALDDHPRLPTPLLCFAASEFGSYLIGTGNDDPPVYLEEPSETGEEEAALQEISPRLSDFLAWPKEPL